MTNWIVDDFAEASRWRSFASGAAKIAVSSEQSKAGQRLRIDFDFLGQKGFVGVRLGHARHLPDVYAFSFRVGADSLRNRLEFKLADSDELNVWRSQYDIANFPAEGKQFYLRSREIDFAWGPAGGGRLKDLGAVEFVITAIQGGRGTVWIEDFQLTDLTGRTPPEVTASSCQTGGIALTVLSPDEDQHWRPDVTDPSPWLQIDFHEPMELGGLVIYWGDDSTTHSFVVKTSDSGTAWETVSRIDRHEGRRCYLPLPIGDSRLVRLCFSAGADVHRIEVLPFDFSRSNDDLFHAIAQHCARGWFPRYLLREQSYWTCAGPLDETTCAVINEEGLVEPDRGTFTLEPFLRISGELVTWAKAVRSVRLEDECLPIPTAVWKFHGLMLETTVFATEQTQESTLLVRYRLTNTTSETLSVELDVAIRPHQVTPPWQRWQDLGGVSEVCEIEWEQGCVWVNESKVVVPLTRPSGFGTMTFERGLLLERLEADSLLMERVLDKQGLASGVLSFLLKISSGAQQEIFLAVPFGFGHRPKFQSIKNQCELDGHDEFAKTVRITKERLEKVDFGQPTGLLWEAVKTYRTAAGQILINRNGPAFQPGPRRYTRCWIRDAAIMGAALIRTGERNALAEFVRWYAGYQRQDGFVPCCVDNSGPDELVEHDSHGQLIYAIVESFRFTRDMEFLREMWSHVRQAAMFIVSLRRERLTPEYERMEKNVCWGLLPESVSHEGYLAQPVHAYWDNFWALRGLKDAAFAASELGLQWESQQLSDQADQLKTCLLASIQRVIDDRQLNYIPGSVEWADFDPTATSNALFLLADTADLPAGQLTAMYEQFLTGVRQRMHAEVPWNNYTAYEIRNIGALVRLGNRSEALELLGFYLSDRRPRRWNQWPEISWKKPRTPGHLGDIPHTWIAAEYILALTSLFAYEREADQSLVIAAGVDLKWITEQKELSVRNLPTWYGDLDLSLSITDGASLQIVIGGLMRLPPGGFILRPPGMGRVDKLLVNGQIVSDFTDGEARVSIFPCEVIVYFQGVDEQ